MDSFHIEKMGWNGKFFFLFQIKNYNNLEADFSCPDEREWMVFSLIIFLSLL